ncbi:MAG: hypothetical protein ACTSR9_18230 [Candidatus Thorarchaeota archaeon]
MDLLRWIQTNRDYSNEWIVCGFIFTLVISLILRTIPLTLGSDLVWLYYFPFWLIIEIILISLFAGYGYLAIILSITIDVNLRTGLLVWPSFLFFSDLLLITLMMFYLVKFDNERYGIEPEAFYFIHPIIFLLVYGIIMFAITRVFSVNMSEEAWVQLFAGLPGAFLIVYYGGVFFNTQFFDRWSHHFEFLNNSSDHQPIEYEQSTPTRRRRPIPTQTRRPSQDEMYMGRQNPESEDIVYYCSHCQRLTTPGTCDYCGRPVS